MTHGMGSRHALAILTLSTLALLLSASALAQEPEPPSRIPEKSAGFEFYQLMKSLDPIDPEFVGPEHAARAPLVPGVGFDAYGFDDNNTLVGTFFIPPDPIGAAGRDRVIAVVNSGIEARDKSGALLFRDSLRNFFAATPGALATTTFDPKVIYDPYEDRFVLLTLEQTDVGSGSPSDESRILVAVSRTATPATPTAADWYTFAIDSKLTIGTGDTWSDYPGLEIDEEAVYITLNQFPFSTSTGSYGQRLWILDKGTGGGFYAGGPPAFTLHDPYGATGVGAFATTTMPAQVFGPGGVAPGVGTFLLSYSGLTFGGPAANEALLLIRVDNPLGAVSFVREFVTIADIEDIGGALGFPALPDAPQSGGPALIEVNDRRLLDAVWRDGRLYACTTIVPNAAFDPVNAGQTTAHWMELDTSAVTSNASPAGLVTTAQQGNAGGEDISPGMFTFFPAIAVNGAGEMKVGFSGSSPTTFGSAYVAGRIPGEPPGFVGPTGVVRSGVDYYLRTFGGTRNRWGDYSGLSVDPQNDTRFWAFNVFADTRGTAFGGEDGRWRTAWLECGFGAPDLVVSRLDVPCCVSWREDLSGSMSVAVTNVGLAPSGATQLQLFVSTDALITPADTPLVAGTVAVPPLAPGATAVLALPPGVAVPGASLSGAVFIGAIADDINLVAESDEGNNTAAAETFVSADVWGCLRGRAFAGLQGPVSVFTVPDGSGNPLSAAQLFTGIGSPPLPFDATITVQLLDVLGNPVSGITPTLASTYGGLSVCAPPPAADGPTDAAGFTTFSGPIRGGGWTDNVNGERLLVVGANGSVIPGLIYGPAEMLASNQTGDLFRVDPFSGFSALLCNVGGSSTEIEWWTQRGFGWNAESGGSFVGNSFEWLACGPTSPSIPTNWIFNGLEAIDGRLYGAGINASCGPSQLFIFDPLAGSEIPVGITGFGPITGLAWDPVCRKLYGSTGCTSTFGPSQILEIDLATGAATPLFSTGTQLGGLEFDANGRLLAGGGTADGANLYEIDLVAQVAIPVGPTGIAPGITGLTLASDAGLDIQVNSADITGDLVVNLADVGAFSALFGGPYDYAIDYRYDGLENLADVGALATTIGATCPSFPKMAFAPARRSEAELLLAFDATGQQRDVDLASGQSAIAYVLARGAIAQAGVLAWESRIESSSNLEINALELVEGSLDLGSDGDTMVGLGKGIRSGNGPVVLARVRVTAKDDQPASLWLRPARNSSVEGAGPALVGGDDAHRVLPAYVVMAADGAAASINVAFQSTPSAVASQEFTAVPNPFNPRTEFRFSLEQSGAVQVRIYDVSGRLVRTLDPGVLDAGLQTLTWAGIDGRGREVTSGIYFARLSVNGTEQGRTQKLTLLK